MTNEPGFYIEQKRHELLKNDYLLWIFRKNGKLYYQEGMAGSVRLSGENEFDLDKYTLVKKLAISRREMAFTGTTITVNTRYGNHQFEFKVRGLVRLYELVVVLLPGLGRSMLIDQLIRKLENLYKKPELRK